MYLGLGPTVYRVEESAAIASFEFKDDNVVGDGHRTDKLVRWRVGADLRLEGGYLLLGRIPLALNVGLSIVPWKAEKVKSLTLDWVEEDYFTVEYFGLTVGYSFY